ncbi:MAG: DUF456 domain-containing protein [Candidatus Doudnabacteria bacterium]|nr:DUF456 domain-containing protein [Candidatus Doudnabacteria bacterium]
MYDLIFEIIAGVLVFGGVAGSLLPILPGPPLGLLGLFLHAYVTGFEAISPRVLIVFLLLTVMTHVLDFLAPMMGAKGARASRAGFWGALIGTIIGMFVAGPLGMIIGALLGGFLGEYLVVPDAVRALKTAWGVFWGFLVSTTIRFSVAVATAVYYLWVIWR